MILTGKARNDFNTWCMDKGFENFNPKDYSLDIAQAMSNAVLIMFFDSFKLTITITFAMDKTFDSFVAKENYEELQCSQFQKTRYEATKKAIEKANEIYNAN